MKDQGSGLVKTIIFALAVIVMFPLTSGADDCIKFALGIGSESTIQMGEKISRHLSSNGYCHSITQLPSKRATKEFLSGKYDGEIGRIQFYRNIVGDRAVMVPVPLYQYAGYLISAKKIMTPQEATGKIAVIRGWIWMAELVKTLPGLKVYEVERADQLVRLMKIGRVDHVLVSTEMVKRYDFSAYHRLKALDLGIYIWVSRSHQDQVPVLERLITDYLNNGKKFVE